MKETGMSDKDITIDKNEIQKLFDDVSTLIADARKRVAFAVNAQTTMLNTRRKWSGTCDGCKSMRCNKGRMLPSGCSCVARETSNILSFLCSTKLI